MGAAALVIATMRVIDEAFASAHPRARSVSATLAVMSPVSEWLDVLQTRRLTCGSFGALDGHRLIPNGPFARHAPGREAAAADTLQARFAALAVAPMISRQEDRVIAIEIKVVGTDIMRGVPAASSIGREKILFVPLAEDKGDLNYNVRARAGQPMLDVQPTVDTTKRLLHALQDRGDVDIAMSPELTIPGKAEAELSAGIASLAQHAPRIILAGTGLSVATGECGRSWNEARVFARGGRVLWRHRKIWPFGMPRDTAVKYGFSDPGDKMLMEDIAADSQITIVDLDGFGRCLVLICQDFQSHPVVDEVITRYQPDWVLTPVLDPGVKVPGWAHQRATSLSKLSQARHLVGSSLSMSFLGLAAGTSEPAVGLAVGPFYSGSKGEEPGRALAIVQALAGPAPRSGVLIWDHASPAWTKTSVGQEQ